MAEVPPKPALSENDELEERKHFQRIVKAFQHYRVHALRLVAKNMKYLSTLPEAHQEMLKNYKQHLDKVRLAIEHNNELVKLIIRDVAYMFENADHTPDVRLTGEVHVTLSDIDKVQSVFKQFVREWSDEGAAERSTCFQPILDELVSCFPEEEQNRRNIRVLVPGAGLGRLAYEIAKRGYTCQGNEFSLFMLFASNFILNRCKGTNLCRIYPWVHQSCNNMKSADQIKLVLFPDVNPSDLPPNSEFSMAAGNFIEIYTEPDSWDSIATCFFLDTGSNIVAYVETIWHILKPGGYWINLGPLLYHYAELPNENSIEPSYEEVKNIILGFGFVMTKEETNLRTPYTQNPRSMMFYEYRSVFFVCRKPET